MEKYHRPSRQSIPGMEMKKKAPSKGGRALSLRLRGTQIAKSFPPALAGDGETFPGHAKIVIVPFRAISGRDPEVRMEKSSELGFENLFGLDKLRVGLVEGNPQGMNLIDGIHVVNPPRGRSGCNNAWRAPAGPVPFLRSLDWPPGC